MEKIFFLLFNHVCFLQTAWTSSCSLFGKVFQKSFIFASFLWLRENDWLKPRSPTDFVPKVRPELIVSQFLDKMQLPETVENLQCTQWWQNQEYAAEGIQFFS